MASNSPSATSNDGVQTRRSKRQRALQPVDYDDEANNENSVPEPPRAKKQRKERTIKDPNAAKQQYDYVLREEQGLNIEAKYGGISRGGSYKQVDRPKTQVRISIQPAITMLAWIKIQDVRGLPMIDFHALRSRSQTNMVFPFLQLWRQLSFNVCIGNESQQTHQFDNETGILAGRTKTGMKYGIVHIKWIISDMLDPTYRPQSIFELLKRMDAAIASGSSNNILLASRLSLLGLNFSWATIFNNPNLNIVVPNAFIKLSLLPIKYAFQAMRGNIDIQSWRKVMQLFDIPSVVPATFVEGVPMPKNDELRRVIQQNPDLLGDRVANDEELLSIFYGTKLSFKQLFLNPQALVHFKDNFDAVIQAKHNALRTDKEVQIAANKGMWDYTIDVIQYRNQLYHEHRTRERDERLRLSSATTDEERVPRDTSIGSFFGDFLVANGTTLPFDHTVMKLKFNEVKPPFIVEVAGPEELLWKIAADKLDLEEMDTAQFERPTDFGEYLGLIVPGGVQEQNERDVEQEQHADD